MIKPLLPWNRKLMKASVCSIRAIWGAKQWPLVHKSFRAAAPPNFFFSLSFEVLLPNFFIFLFLNVSIVYQYTFLMESLFCSAAQVFSYANEPTVSQQRLLMTLLDWLFNFCVSCTVLAEHSELRLLAQSSWHNWTSF